MLRWIKKFFHKKKKKVIIVDSHDGLAMAMMTDKRKKK